MKSTARLLLFVALGAALCVQAAAAADTTPIRLIVPFAPGGSADQIARLVGAGMAQRLGTPVLVENKAGAGGVLAADHVAKSAPDGKTFLIGSNGPLVINKGIYAKLPYDPARDLVPVVGLAETPLMLLVRREGGVGSVAELLGRARSRRDAPPPMGSAGSGNITHLAGFYLSRQIGFVPQHVPYKGSAPAITALLGGEIEIMYDALPSSLQHAKANGRLQALAITSSKRLPALPDTPTFKELGFDVGKVTAWFGIAAPARTKADEIKRVNAAANAVLADPAVRERLVAIGFEAMGGSPGDFQAVIQAEMKRWIPLAKSLNVAAD
ncbi:MAG TPA: tripartite tricarboxylate transporter substrate-binding protein [Ramlibacter sp.]|nr:tripartite tricarboxylate transporter substrate-binding protein [Ramlibacter sp.]